MPKGTPPSKKVDGIIKRLKQRDVAREQRRAKAANEWDEYRNAKSFSKAARAERAEARSLPLKSAPDKSFQPDWIENTYTGKALDFVSGGRLSAAGKKRNGYSEGGIVINMKGSCEKEGPETEMEMAKGGMVKSRKRKSIQVQGWGKARRR